MSKQDIVIKIAKITRITGEIKYSIDVSGTVDLALYVPDLLYIDKWMEQIYSYVLTDSSPELDQLISNMGFNDFIERYIQNHRDDIKASFLEVLDNFFFISRELSILCMENSTERKGVYSDLIEPLANKQVAELLDRAVDAGLLDEHYQPRPKIRMLHLKIIAFAVSSICKFRCPYELFEKQWGKMGNNRISTCRIPKYKTDEYESTKGLYPEVDFSRLEPSHEKAVFYTMQDLRDINSMYLDLIKYRYIAPDTTFETFKGILGKAGFSRPVEWIKDQRRLSFFIHLTFNKYNRKDLWIKGECCFRINGRIPHKDSFVSGYSSIKRAGWLDNYDTRLKGICDRFNHVDTSLPSAIKCNERLIHTSECVFYSPQTDMKKKAMYSALIAGGYIAPDTTYETFRGILDEIEFTRPVVWLKSQNLLVYFVYIAFKMDNPYDLWTKCVYCFRFQNDKSPKKENLSTNCKKQIKKVDPDNLELKRIADEYKNNINNGTEVS